MQISNPKVIWLLHLAFLRKIIIEFPSQKEAKIEKAGKEIGRRLLDCFCAKFLIYNTIDDDKIEKYLNFFLKNYIGNAFAERNTIVFKDSISENQRDIGILLLKTIIENIFKSLNENISFDIQNNLIVYFLNQNDMNVL